MGNLETSLVASPVPFSPRLAGWAIRKPKGKRYGAKYISKYATDVKEYFQRGVANSTDKMQPAGMLFYNCIVTLFCYCVLCCVVHVYLFILFSYITTNNSFHIFQYHTQTNNMH